MAGPLRVEHEGSVYHAMRRASARRDIVNETHDGARLRDRPAQTVERLHRSRRSSSACCHDRRAYSGIPDLTPIAHKDVRKGQAGGLQHGSKNEPKSTWQKSSSLIK
jgi:hypothetical protein